MPRGRRGSLERGEALDGERIPSRCPARVDANTYTVLYDVILPRYHSSASGVMIMTGFAIGALAPLVLGMVKQAAGLSFGISMLAVVWLVCGVVMLLGAKYFYMRDYNKIRHE